MRTCRSCQGAVVDSGERVWWAGKFCHCCQPAPHTLKDWYEKQEQARKELPPLRQLPPLNPVPTRAEILESRVVALARERDELRERLATLRAHVLKLCDMYERLKAHL